MMIEKRQRCANREGMQPQRYLGEFDGHRVFVNAINAALEDHAADNVAVVELIEIQRPLLVGGILENDISDILDAIAQRRNILGPFTKFLGFGDSSNNLIGEVIDERDQKVS